jgi:hypothetical protein
MISKTVQSGLIGARHGQLPSFLPCLLLTLSPVEHRWPIWGCTFLAALMRVYLRARLPPHRLPRESSTLQYVPEAHGRSEGSEQGPPATRIPLRRHVQAAQLQEPKYEEVCEEADQGA